MTDDKQKITSAQHLDSENFQSTLDEADDKVVFVDFYAEWCGPCKLAAPIVDKLAVEYQEKALITKLDVDENNDVAAQYGVMSIPTVILFKKKDGKVTEVGRKIGFPGEQGYRQLLDSALKVA
jgi:thioredoxin 1